MPKYKILIVEDHAEWRLTLNDFFVKKEFGFCYDVITVPDAQTAIEHLRTKEYQIASLDINLGTPSSGEPSPSAYSGKRKRAPAVFATGLDLFDEVATKKLVQACLIVTGASHDPELGTILDNEDVLVAVRSKLTEYVEPKFPGRVRVFSKDPRLTPLQSISFWRHGNKAMDATLTPEVVEQLVRALGTLKPPYHLRFRFDGQTDHLFGVEVVAGLKGSARKAIITHPLDCQLLHELACLAEDELLSFERILVIYCGAHGIKRALADGKSGEPVEERIETRARSCIQSARRRFQSDHGMPLNLTKDSLIVPARIRAQAGYKLARECTHENSGKLTRRGVSLNPGAAARTVIRNYETDDLSAGERSVIENLPRDQQTLLYDYRVYLAADDADSDRTSVKDFAIYRGSSLATVQGNLQAINAAFERAGLEFRWPLK
jgi:CheY-like chemotaxis protein